MAKYMKMGSTVLSLLLVIFLALPIWGAVPGEMNFQGKLTDANDNPLNGLYDMEFGLYTTSVGGTLLWSETQTNVPVVEGIYAVQLGAVNPLDPDDFANNEAWLTVEVEGEPMSPSLPVNTVGFSFRAAEADNAETLEGSVVADFAAAGHDHDSFYVNEGQADAITSAMIADGVVTAADLSINSVTASEIATGAVTSTDVADNSLSAADLAANSVTASEIAAGAVGSEEIATGAVTPQKIGIPLWLSGDVDGGLIKATNGHSTGVGVYGQAIGSSGFGTWGYATGESGMGARGTASNTGSVTNYGGYFSAAGSYGRGVYGIATNTGSATNYGGYFKADGISGRGVYGIANGSSGTGGYFSSSSGRGGYFYSYSGPAGVFYSTYGDGLIVSKGNVGIGTADPASELHIVGTGNMSELIISPDGDNGTSKLLMCQDPDCNNGSIWRYDGVRNSLYLYFKDSTGSGFDDDRDKIAFKIEHHGQNDARIGINLPKEHDIRNILEVGGKILAEEIQVVANIADYVFDDDYPLMSLEKVEKYINENHHLPGIVSKADVVMGGGTVSLGAAYTQLLEKIEELTLYVIEQNQTLTDQHRRMADMSKTIDQLRMHSDLTAKR